MEGASPFLFYQDLDAFLARLYEYHQSQGYACRILKEVADILTYLIVVFIIVFLAFFIDYSVLMSADVSGSVNFWKDIVHIHGGFGLPFVILILFGVYPVYRTLQLVLKLPELGRMKRFYASLDLSEKEIHLTPWSTVVARLIQLPGPCAPTPGWTELDVVNVLMRRENFFLGLINHDILDFNLSLLSWVPTGHPKVPFFFANDLLESIILTVTNWCLWENHNHLKSTVKLAQNEEAYLGMVASELSHWFTTVGVLFLITLPVSLSYIIVYYIFKYGSECRNNPSVLGFRVWSTVARWRFREFNELPHSLEDRLNKGMRPAKLFCQHMGNPSLNIIGRLFSFFFGALFFSIVFLSLWSDSILSSIEFFPEKSGIWVLGILGFLVAVSRFFVCDSCTEYDPEKCLVEVSKYTHFMPDGWRSSAGRFLQTKSEFAQLFPNTLTFLLTDLGGLVIAPLILIFRLSADTCARRIVLFYSKYSLSDPTLGDVCKYAVFPLNSDGDPLYGSVSSMPHLPDRVLKNGKLESSFLSFYKDYVSWRPDEAGQLTLQRLADCVASFENFPPNRDGGGANILPQNSFKDQSNREHFFSSEFPKQYFSQFGDDGTHQPQQERGALSRSEIYHGPLDRSIHMSDIQESCFLARQRGQLEQKRTN